MRLYEATYILQPELEEENLTKAQEKYSEMVTKAGGEILNVESWGKRKLAYEILGKNEGFYVVMRFNAPQKTADDLRRDFSISDDVMKSLVIRLN